ncbi:MAG: ABC transporter ATP-binding protein/permease [Lachnospiraceae bacterium]|nr:ABC transporter ATP-binding protein/permease [Lachnospiraceae bacterium]
MIKTLTKSIREYKKHAILTPIFMCGEVSMETMIPFIMALLIDSLQSQNTKDLLMYGGILICIAFLSLFFGCMSARQAADASCGFAKNLRHDMFHKVMNFSFSDVDTFSTSSLVTRMTTDVTNLQNAFGMMIRMAVRVPLMFLFSIIMGCRINWKLTMIFIVIVPFLAFSILMISRKVRGIFKRIFKKYDALNNSVQENVSAIRVVKGFVREDYEIEKFKARSEEVRNDFTVAEKWLAAFNPLMTFFMDVAMILLMYFGAKIIISTGNNPVPELTTGQLSSLTGYGIQILSALMMLGMVFVMITMAGEAGNRVCEVLEYEPTLDVNPDGVTEVLNGDVKFDHVSFKYSEGAKKNALEDINLDVKSGETIGIIGGTGSSKSTLIQLISRLYDVTEGAVYVGGKDVREYNLKALRDQVAVVLQKNILFAGTINENMRWGKKDATQEEIIAACKAACADEFISGFPDKYETFIEQGGTNVSGGQKQRLCIARALLKNPKVLILDDSTSAVDTRTDALIRKSFKEMIPGTTKFIIAQRVSSVEDADKIIVLDGGRIVEAGTSEELIAKKGIYAEIYETQTKGKEA